MNDWQATVPARSGGSDPSLHRLTAVLGAWRNSLLDMGGRNRLLNFRHTRTATLELESPDAFTILSRLGRGWGFAPVEDEPNAADGGSSALRQAPDTSGLVTQKTSQATLDSAVYRLRQKSHQMYNDYGLWVLWLGVGMLDWREAGAQEGSSAPLVLVPVELRRDGRGGTRLQLADDQDRLHNTALAVKFDRLGVDWSPVTGADVTDLHAVLSAARDVADTQAHWSVSERVVLGLFASYKEAMYQDLQQNEELILNHPLVRAVALGPDSGLPDDLLGFEPPALDRIDEVQPPEDIPLVLDADASQRQCIAAALDGRSFVMSGPPGTGKSQTITNMIAALMHAGRSILFVSEKAAALDVVRNRLRSVGLGDFVMALHSGDTSKKAVATELARVLTTEARVTGAAEHELDRARQLREELSAYAAGMNQVREPLDRTLHDVLGRLVLLERAGIPQLSLGVASAKSVRTLSARALHDLITAAGAISRAWRPAADGEAFAWRGLVATSAAAVASEAADALEALRTVAERRPFPATVPEPRTVLDLEQVVRTLRAGLPAGEPVASDAAVPEDLSGTLAQLADTLGMPKPRTVEAAFALFELTDLASSPHRPPRPWFNAADLLRAHEAARELRQALAAESAARETAQDVFGEQVLTASELPALTRRFAEQHRGVFVRFSSQYKADRAAVEAFTRSGTWDKTLPGRLEQALAWQIAAAEVIRLAEVHGAPLGRYTPRCQDDLPALDQALANADRINELAGHTENRDRLAANLADDSRQDPQPGLLARSARNSLRDWCDAAARRAARWSESAAALLDLFDEGRRVQLSPSLLGTLGQARHAIDALLADPQGPEEWQAYRNGLATLARFGIEDPVPRAVERGILPERLPAVVEQAVLRTWADDILATDDRLHTTRSDDLDARVIDFSEADRRLVAAAGGAVIEACNGRRPRRFGGGAAAVITREAEKKRRHMPVRELLGRTGEVTRSIKPCFMMSPLTVSQFLPADYHFDVVIFDEASQVRPSDAVNCIYRGRSLVVAGDDKQLPPTSFFDSSVEDESDEYDEDLPDSFESLLDACKAGAVRVLPLRWHYRSRHEDLITFSNRSFYRNSMVTFPGAVEHGNDVAVAFYRAEGVYDRGGRRDNRTEAERVAERVIHHFDTRPGRTLGVVALSQAQATAIDEAVQAARLLRPDLDDCFTEGRLDGFFIKNLESVQGDERDVMIMSIGYGPDEHGKLGLNFGPINKDGGWRRLNVAVTRARYRVEVIASFAGSALADSTNESVQHLKRYLEYAENGVAALTRDLEYADAEPESPFEESVLEVLRDWGYQVQPQVGVAGYRIDLGVRHPEAPGSYALGIECDGAMYHSSKAARDRDRLREQVLAGLGWRLYRIWGTDWYRGRASAELRLREAVEQAVARGPLTGRVDRAGEESPPATPAVAGAVGDGNATGGATGPEREAAGRERYGDVVAVPDSSMPVEHERVPVDTDPERDWCAPYEVCGTTIYSPYELHTPEARPALRRFMTSVIQVEGPIHEDLLVQRAREAWGLARAGNRIRGNVHVVVRALVGAGQATVHGDFVDSAGRTEVKARYSDGGEPRKAAHVAPVERRLALFELAAECPGMSRDELIRHACEFFGWRRAGRDIRGILESDITYLYEQGRFVGTGGRITAVR